MSLDAGETPALPGKDRHPKVQHKANLHFQVEKPGTNLGHVVLAMRGASVALGVQGETDQYRARARWQRGSQASGHTGPIQLMAFALAAT